MPAPHATIDDYIASLPEEVQVVVRRMRDVIRNAVPAAGERISYGIPAFTLGGRDLIYVAAWKRHIAVYPVPAAGGALERDLAPYRAAKATVRFPLGKPIPYDLIERLAAFRLATVSPGPGTGPGTSPPSPS